MVVRATQALGALLLRIAAHILLFAIVVMLHLAITGALRGLGLDNGVALLVSGAAVLTLVLSGLSFLDRGHKRRAKARRAADRKQQGAEALAS